MRINDVGRRVFDTTPLSQFPFISPTVDDQELSAVAWAEFYGFLWHRRVYACPIDGAPLETSSPSRIEDLLGDG